MLPVQIRAAISIVLVAQVWGEINLATNKPAIQSGDYVDSSGATYSASFAVDGNTGTFSHTAVDRDVNWWRVNLGAKYTFGSIRIYNRGEGYNGQLRRTSILTSIATSPSTPSLTSNDWTNITYQGPAYGDVGTHTFNPPIDGQHVAVYNEESGGLALGEVQVYDYNYALHKLTDSSSTTRSPSLATDGDLSTSSATNNEQSPWWKVDLGEAILFREVLVFAKQGTHLTNVYFLTNPSNTAAEPNTARNDGWRKCYYSEQSQGDYYTVQCNIGYTYPLTRLFSIRSSAETSIELRQVEVYGFELPQLSGNIDGKADTATTTSITLSFMQWNQLMIGGSPPTKYTVLLLGGESKTLVHNSSSQRLSTTFDGLDPWKAYTFTVSCTIQGIACTGSTHSFTAFTSCAVPRKPGEITLSSPVERLHENRQRWEYTASWGAPNKANCNDTVQYQYNLVGESTSALQTTTTATFYVDGDLPFDFIVKAKNSVGFSTLKSTSERSGVLKPQFGSGRISVTAKNSTCVTYTWSEPLYPGGTISHYQHRCSGDSWMGASGIGTKDSCGHLPYTQITCWVRANNSAPGWGTTQAAGRTECAVPTSPQNISLALVEVEHSGRNRWRLTANWKAPNRANCNGSIQYKYGIQGEPTSTPQSGMSVTYYLEGDQSYEFVVQANNSVGFSAKLSESGKTDPLAPQFGTNQISLTGKSSECVKLSWTEPQYPGGDITQYQYRCGEDTFTNLGLQITNKESCGHEPYTNVTCRFRAGNIAGFSNNQTKVASTLCAGPVFTQTPSATEGYDSERKRRMVTVDVQGVKKHCATLDPIQYKVLDREFSTDTTIRQLNAITKYNITIKATNNRPLSTSVYINVMTGELEPWDGPQITDKYSESKTCAVVEWKEPLQPNGVIIQYQYQCARQDLSYPTGWTNTTATSLSDCGYDSGNLVKCRVKAATAIGYGPAVNATLNITCDNPSAPDFNLSSYEGIDNSATIQVYLQESKHWCNSLKPYTITIRGPEGEWLYNTTNATAGNHTIENAVPFTNYTVTVEAINDAALKSLTVQSIVTVETEAPKRPKLKLVSNTTDCVYVNATRPEIPNGVVLQYTFTCNVDENDESMSKVVEAVDENGSTTFCGFTSASLVTCSAAAHNSAGIGEESAASIYTQLSITNRDSSKPKFAGRGNKGDRIKIKPIEVERGDVSFYLVMLQPKGIVKRGDVSSSGCTKQSVNITYGTDSACYTTAQLSAKEVGKQHQFTVGDDKTHDGYLNGKLEAGIEYELYIAVKVEVPPHAPLIALLDPITFTALQGLTPGGIAGLIIGVFLLIGLACAAAFLFWRFRLHSAKSDKTEYDAGFIDIGAPINSPPRMGRITSPSCNVNIGFEVDGDESGEEDDAYGNTGQILRHSEPIPVDRLEWYINSNTETIKDQYESLRSLAPPIMDIALLEENKGKCRYKKLYPSNKHRVKLQRSGDGETDFINASYLKGYAREVQYIAAQGPFTETVVKDFWLMIWQQRPSAIVMVTKAVENSKMKCLQYWPLEENVAQWFGDFTVLLKGSETYCDFSLNHLEVTKNGETRVIPHFNYLHWPDHGVPDIEVFVAFHRLVCATIKCNDKQPLLVHCSAGVGRTGTYIALDYLLEQAKTEGVVDMYECVKEMRSRRPNMIQTVEQFILLHHALYESLATETFSCLPSDLDSKLQMHLQQPGNDTDVITAEYNHASNRTASLNLSFTTAKETQNENKNRFPQILPSEMDTPFLTNGADGKYINAVFVDGYKEKKQWIATQLPLSNTIADFWQLILEQDIKIIVQLEGGQKPYYPVKDGAVMKVEPFVIKTVDSSTRDVLKTVNILLHKEEVTRSVQVLVLKNWISETLPTTDAIISLHEAAGNLQQQMYSKKMCVTCLDGSSRCGLFICAHNAIEKLKAEQVVDLYYATVMAKLRRPQFIPTVEQYRCLYHVLKDYMNAFGEYANFG